MARIQHNIENGNSEIRNSLETQRDRPTVDTPTDYMDAHGACPHCGLRPPRVDRHDCHCDLAGVIRARLLRVVRAGRAEHIALLRDIAATLEDKR